MYDSWCNPLSQWNPCFCSLMCTLQLFLWALVCFGQTAGISYRGWGECLQRRRSCSPNQSHWFGPRLQDSWTPRGKSTRTIARLIWPPGPPALIIIPIKNKCTDALLKSSLLMHHCWVSGNKIFSKLNKDKCVTKKRNYQSCQNSV